MAAGRRHEVTDSDDVSRYVGAWLAGEFPGVVEAEAGAGCLRRISLGRGKVGPKRGLRHATHCLWRGEEHPVLDVTYARQAQGSMRSVMVQALNVPAECKAVVVGLKFVQHCRAFSGIAWLRPGSCPVLFRRLCG
jgi:hypothetical protein